MNSETNQSFASKVKEELSSNPVKAGCCVKAAEEASKYFTLSEKPYKINNGALNKRCCKKTFLKQAFLEAGTVADPEKSYHLEIACPNIESAVFIQSLIETFGIKAKIAFRKKNYGVYLKGSDAIMDILGIMGASKAFMDAENVRILKEMRNGVNRRVNCETANINKTVSASVKQIEDIKLIAERIGFEKLPPSLAEMADVRLSNPDATLNELTTCFDPPLTKSGVNHRLRKLAEIAGKLK